MSGSWRPVACTCRRCGAGAAEHPHEGCRGGRHPGAQPARVLLFASATSSAALPGAAGRTCARPRCARGGLRWRLPRPVAHRRPRLGRTSWRGPTACPPAQVHEREAALGPHSTADLMFTSGTTGRPKGVMAAHMDPPSGPSRMGARWSGSNEGDRYLVVNPFFHSFGYKAGWLAALMNGCTTVPRAGLQRGRARSARSSTASRSCLGRPRSTSPCWRTRSAADFDISSLRPPSRARPACRWS
jgi:hypothetical protein